MLETTNRKLMIYLILYSFWVLSCQSASTLEAGSPRLTFTSGIRCILEDAAGNIWFGSHQEGVAKFDGQNLQYFTMEDGLSDNQVRSMYLDQEGNIWFECGVGVSWFDGEKISAYVQKEYTQRNDWQLAPGDLWFKTDPSFGFHEKEGQHGVYRYDGKSLGFLAFPAILETQEAFYYSVSTPFVRRKNGSVWFGTYGAAIGYDGDQFSIIDNEALGFNELTGFLHIRSLFEDSQGNLWIGNNGIGVLVDNGKAVESFSAKHGLTIPWSAHDGSKSPDGTLEHVFAIGEDAAGNIWFGDRDTGAWRYDGEEMKNFTKQDGLLTTHIWQIYNSKDGGLWFAMGDGTVCAFRGDRFERIF